MEKRGKIVDVVIIDTGIIYAISDKRDVWHKRSVDFVTKFKGKIIAPSTIIPETCYLLNTYLGQSVEKSFISALVNKELIIENYSIDDLKRCVEILKKYETLNIGIVDASIIAIAERMRIRKIITTDRRHFSTIKPNHIDYFTLLPE